MPRPPRIDFPGARHHVMNRGARKQTIFPDDSSRIGFLSRLGQVAVRYDVAIHGFVLMPNHFHLMAESRRGLLSDCMRDLQSPFARKYNWLRGADWDGPLFRDRFESRLVYREDHWAYLLPYLHLNPLRARLVMDLSQFDWSSHFVYSGEARCPEWLYTEELKRGFGTPAGYREFIAGIAEKRYRPPDEFERVLFTLPADIPAVVPVELDEHAIEAALHEVAAVSGRSLDELGEVRCGRKGNPARLAAIYWLTSGLGLSLSETGRRLGMSPSSTGHAMSRIRRRLDRDDELTRIITNLTKLREK